MMENEAQATETNSTHLDPAADEETLESEAQVHETSTGYIESSNEMLEKVFQCNTCQGCYKSVSGIKSHITKMHKNLKNSTSEKETCKKCQKIIQTKDVGTCIACGGKEHYNCTQTGKKHSQEFRDGTLTFKCIQCCLPGLILEDVFKEEEENAKLQNKEVEIGEESDLGEGDNALVRALEELSKQNDQIQRKMQVIIMDNTVLTDEITKLKAEKDKLQDNNNNLATECTKIKQDYSNLQIDYSKAKDSALNNQTTLRARAKEAKAELEKCEREIAKQQKQIDQLRAENSTYKDLIVYQKGRLITEPEPKNLKVAVRTITRNGKAEEQRTVSSNEDPLPTHDENQGRRGAADKEHGHVLVRFCHFYNRKGCSKKDCAYLHEDAPLCKNHLRGKCTRRFCMFSHKDQDFRDGQKARQKEEQDAESTVRQPDTNTTNPDEQELLKRSQETEHHRGQQNQALPEKKNDPTNNQWQEQAMLWQTQPQPWQYPPNYAYQNQNQWSNQQWNNQAMQLNYANPYPSPYPTFPQGQHYPMQYMKINQ